MKHLDHDETIEHVLAHLLEKRGTWYLDSDCVCCPPTLRRDIAGQETCPVTSAAGCHGLSLGPAIDAGYDERACRELAAAADGYAPLRARMLAAAGLEAVTP